MKPGIRAANPPIEIIRRPIGLVLLCIRRGAETVFELEEYNLFVNAGLPALASLLGGDTAGNMAAAIGFGTGSNAPTVADIGLTAPAYYKTLDGHSENGTAPGAGSVQFAWSLTSSDTGANGLTIQELGLFSNPTSVVLPGPTAPATILARKTIAPITFSAGMTLSGTWTLTF
jgi:hypothetical protein